MNPRSLNKRYFRQMILATWLKSFEFGSVPGESGVSAEIEFLIVSGLWLFATLLGFVGEQSYKTFLVFGIDQQLFIIVPSLILVVLSTLLILSLIRLAKSPEEAKPSAMNVKQGYMQNYIDGEAEKAAAGYLHERLKIALYDKHKECIDSTARVETNLRTGLLVKDYPRNPFDDPCAGYCYLLKTPHD